jgi:hypothetical protein
MICFFRVHSVITYGIISCGNSPYSINVFRIQKEWSELLRIQEVETLLGNFLKTRKTFLPTVYISLLLFVVKNKDQCKSNQEVHSINTRHGTNLHPPVSNLAKFKRGAYYFGIKGFGHFPSTIKILSNEMKLFRPSFKRYLLSKPSPPPFRWLF